MSPRTVNPKSHASRRDEFVDAGQQLIQSKGYEQLSIEDVLAVTGASKGAFYHYFGSKQELLEAVIDRMVTVGMGVVAQVVADPDLSAMEKLQRYFSTLADYKGERRDFLAQVISIWYSDDNAIVREHFRKRVVSEIGPQFAAIIRQGVAEGTFALTQPDLMARVVLSLMLDTGDQAGELYLARHAGKVSLDDVRQQLATYESALERVLGVSPGTLQLISEPTIRLWFEEPFEPTTNPPRWTTDPPAALPTMPDSSTS